jgi:hypothetical protein
MKTFKSIILFVFALSHSPAISQTAGLEFNFGIGAYSMTDMHDLYDYYVAESGKNYKTVTDFPSEFYYGITFVVGIGKFETGIDYDRYETTGLLQGTYNGLPASFSDELTGFAVGLFGKYPLYYSPKLQVKAGIVAAYNGTRDKTITTESGVTTTVYQFRSESFLLTPFAETSYSITKWLYIGARANFGYDLGAKLHDKEERDIILPDQNGDPVKTNWTGMRADVFLGFRMNNE